jgi:hypothetical protein
MRAAAVLAAVLALAGCAGASHAAPAPYVTPSVPASIPIATPPPPLVPDTKADREACTAFVRAAAGEMPDYRLSAYLGTLKVRSGLLVPMADWIVRHRTDTLEDQYATVVADCESIGVP